MNRYLRTTAWTLVPERLPVQTHVTQDASWRRLALAYVPGSTRQPPAWRPRPAALDRIIALPSRLAVPRLVWAALLVAAINLYIVAAGLLRLMAHPFDWFVFEEAVERLADGTLYQPHGDYVFLWSPIAAWLLALIVPLGVQAWQAAAIAALGLLGDWRLIALTLLALPFWIDTMIANTVVFVAVAGVLALRGSRWGALVYLALCLLMPRPLQVPLAVWILWKRPDTRGWFVAMAAASVSLVIWSGYGPAWTDAVMSFAGDGILSSPANLSPTALVGTAWLVVGLPLAAWLTLRGRVGLAGLAMSPYVLPMYPLVLLWDWGGRPSSSRRRGVKPSG